MNVKELYDLLNVRCSYCESPRGESCRTTAGKTVHRQHTRRLYDYYKENDHIARTEEREKETS